MQEPPGPRDLACVHESCALAGLAMVFQPGGPAPLVGPVRRLEKTAEGRSRIRIPSELSTARILVRDDAGRQSNFVPIQVGADGR